LTHIDSLTESWKKMVVKVQVDDSLEGIKSSVFKEYRIQSELNEAGSQHILNARTASCRERPTSPTFLGYIYLDWAPFGSLDDLLENAPTGKQFPEPFLWLIFRGLAEALHVQLTGLAVAPNDPPQEESTRRNNQLLRRDGWEVVVNTDIKLGNIVLGHSQRDHYPAYKTVQLIDFGIAIPEGRYTYIPSNEDDDESDGACIARGTEGCRPPVSLSIPSHYSI
jgi:hypothetical protein